MTEHAAALKGVGGAPRELIDLLRGRRVEAPRGLAARILEQFGAQIGEIGWHSMHVDATIDSVSETHAESICSLVKKLEFKSPRILEVGAYAHYSAQLAAERTGGLAVSHDISPPSLREGRRRAEARGVRGEHVAVAGDFHSLPFEDGAFDVVFIASAVHHTWRPWEVMAEMARVTRAGGVIRLENEPVGRAACVYQFRGNRPERRTRFEQELETLGLTWTVSSPFPGSRDEELFGMTENDRIPLEIYEASLGRVGEIWDWTLTPLMGDFERWILTRPSTSEIVRHLQSSLSSTSRFFTETDALSGFEIPRADDLWPMAYRISAMLEEGARSQEERNRLNTKLFGAALKATIVKLAGERSESIFSRNLGEIDGVHIDLPASDDLDIELQNKFPDLPGLALGPAWTVLKEDNGYHSLANLTSDCDVLLLRTYSIKKDEPYFFSVTVSGRLAYSRCVVASESHLASIYVHSGDTVVVHHHDAFGYPVDCVMHSRVAPKFVRAAQKSGALVLA